MPLHTKPDANGKPRLPPRGAAMLYGVVRQARPIWAMYQAALVATAMFKAQTSLAMPPAEFGAMLDGLLEERVKNATERERTQASARAVIWEKNPYLKEEMALLFRREMVRPAARTAAEWLGDVQRRGTKAEKAKKFSAALEASKLEADYMPPEDMPKKETGLPSQPPLIGQVNLNVILANPESRRALEAVVRILEGQSSGGGGQVVAGTVAQS